MKSSNVLILPGWQSSGPGHWQTQWEQRHGYVRVEQHDWIKPLRGDWLVRLEEMILTRDEPVVLVAHSLGCILAAAWSAHSRNTNRVKGALLHLDYALVARSARLVVDTRNALARQRRRGQER